MTLFLLLLYISSVEANKESLCSDELDCRIDEALEDTTKLHKLYQDYRVKHGVVHRKLETSSRVKLFRKFLVEVQALRRMQVPWTAGITHFAHMTQCEQDREHGVNVTELEQSRKEHNNRMLMDPSLDPDHSRLYAPSEFDWRSRGAVTEVHHQIGGTCWVHAAVGVLEAQLMIVSGKLKELSTQEIIDCSHEKKKNEGGLPSHAWSYIKTTSHRLGLRDDIKDREVNKPCKYTHKRNGLKGYRIKAIRYPEASENQVITVLSRHSPLAVVINFKGSGLKSYKRGPYDWSIMPCSSKSLHAMLMVGYDKKLFFIKNSWGSDWGNEGYLWWLRGIHGHNCDLFRWQSYAELEKET